MILSEKVCNITYMPENSPQRTSTRSAVVITDSNSSLNDLSAHIKFTDIQVDIKDRAEHQS